jgi:hypothetical protein
LILLLITNSRAYAPILHWKCRSRNIFRLA